MEILIKAAQLFLSLSILVVLHELGHFIPAKLFKTRVEKFYLFFNPWFSLFKFKKGETTYGVGWLPLGGYVKIAGMVDESMDKEQMKQPAQPWEFRSKPAWQRLIIMIGGVTVNLILGILIYAMILFTWGESYLPTDSVKYGIAVDSVGYEMGLRTGDKIVSVDGKEIERFNQITVDMLINQAQTVTVERDGELITIDIPSDFVKTVLENNVGGFIEPRLPVEVHSLPESSVAKEAGLQVDDKILAVNGEQAMFLDKFKDMLNDNKSQPITLTVLRGADTVNLAMTVPESGLIGFALKNDAMIFDLAQRDYGLVEAFPAGVSKAYNTLALYVKQIKLIIDPDTEGYKHVGGFVTIGSLFTPKWNWLAFWEITAFLSLILAFMNILPIPALDGGHVMFTLYEMVSGRKPSEKFLEYAQMAGMVLLLALVIFANGNDIYKAIVK